MALGIKEAIEYEKVFSKELATGAEMVCPRCGGGTGPTRKGAKIKPLQCLCFTCYFYTKGKAKEIIKRFQRKGRKATVRRSR